MRYPCSFRSKARGRRRYRPGALIGCNPAFPAGALLAAAAAGATVLLSNHSEYDQAYTKSRGQLPVLAPAAMPFPSPDLGRHFPEIFGLGILKALIPLLAHYRPVGKPGLRLEITARRGRPPAGPFKP